MGLCPCTPLGTVTVPSPLQSFNRTLFPSLRFTLSGCSNRRPRAFQQVAVQSHGRFLFGVSKKGRCDIFERLQSKSIRSIMDYGKWVTLWHPCHIGGVVYKF